MNLSMCIKMCYSISLLWSHIVVLHPHNAGLGLAVFSLCFPDYLTLCVPPPSLCALLTFSTTLLSVCERSDIYLTSQSRHLYSLTETNHSRTTEEKLFSRGAKCIWSCGRILSQTQKQHVKEEATHEFLLLISSKRPKTCHMYTYFWIDPKWQVWLHNCRRRHTTCTPTHIHINADSQMHAHIQTPWVALGPSLLQQELCVFHTSKVATQTKLKLIWPHSITHTHTQTCTHTGTLLGQANISNI